MAIRHLLSSLLLLSAFSTLLLGLQIIRLKKIKEKKYFFFLLISCSLYAFGYCLEIQGNTLEWIHKSLIVEYAGISFMPAFLILFALSYTIDTDTIPLIKIVLFSISFITFILMITEPHHTLLHKNHSIDYSGPFPIFSFDKGIWYWVHITYINSAVLISNVIFLKMYFKSHARYKTQGLILFFSSLIPWIAFMIYLLEFISWPVDINPFAFTLMSLIIYLGSKDQNILEIVPIARDTVFENIYDAVIVLDTKGIIVDYNRAAEYLLGKEKIIGTSIQSILKKYFDDNTVIDIANIDSFNEVTINNKVFNIRHISFTNKKGQNIGSAFILRDITEYKLLTQKLHELAVTDDLTGISNRRHFFDNASRELFRSKRASRPLSIIMFDIDHFKSVNDTYGHAVGDNVLKKIAARISSNLRSLDIYARYGGEEFIICLPETTLEDAKNVAERLRIIVEETIMQDTNNNDFKVTVSLGVAALSHDSDALEQIIEQADKALYKAKQGGRNRVGV